MAITTTSNLPPAIQAYYDKRFLLRAEEVLAAYQFGQKRTIVMPEAVGKAVYFSRYTPIAKKTTALTEAVDGGITPVALKTEEISATVALWGDFFQISQLASLTQIDKNVSEKTDLAAQQAGLSIDWQVMIELCTKINRVRQDNDSTYQKTGTATAAGSSTTVLVGSNLGQANNYWAGGYLVITAGTNYGEVRLIDSSLLASTSVTTLTAFPKAIDATSQYRVIVGTGVVDTDVLNTLAIRIAKKRIKWAKALTLEKGYYIALVDPDVEFDFMGDTTWANAATYKDEVDALYTGEIGKWFGIRFVGTTQPYRESVAGVQADDAAVHIVPIIGRECYGVVELEKQGQRKIYVRNWDQLGQALPFYSTCGWQIGFVPKTLNGMFGVGVMCGATA